MEARKAEKRGKILIAIGPSPNSSYLVEWAKRTASAFDREWAAVHVDTGRKLTKEDAARLDANLVLCRESGAEAIIQESSDIAEGVVSVAREIGATMIVIGRSGLSKIGLLPRRFTVSDRIMREADPIDVAVVRDSGVSDSRGRPGRMRALFGASFLEYAILALSFALATGVGFLLSPLIGYRSVALLYLAAVLGLSFLIRPVPVSIFAVASALVLNFFFMEPRYTLRITTAEDAFLFMSYFLVAIVTGSLASRLGRKERMLRERERRNAFLLESTMALAQCHSAKEAAEAAVSLVRRSYESACAVLMPDGDGFSAIAASDGEGIPDEGLANAVRSAMRSKKPGGGTASRMRCVPAFAGDRPVGAIAVETQRGRPWRKADDGLMLSLGRTFAFIVERERAEDDRRRAALAEESERLSKLLLDSVSHELRTPLTTITGSLSALRDEAVAEEKESRNALVDGALDASDRLNRIVEDILSMNRIESGIVTLSLSWVDPSDLAGEAVTEAGGASLGDRVKVDLEPGLEPVRIDLGLASRMIANLIGNAARYSAPGSPIDLRIVEEGEALAITVRDRGPGVPQAELGSIFERFKRGRDARGGGLGLGLAICKGIALVHGGSIEARNAPGGGFEVRAVLPRDAGGRTA